MNKNKVTAEKINNVILKNGICSEQITKLENILSSMQDVSLLNNKICVGFDNVNGKVKKGVVLKDGVFNTTEEFDPISKDNIFNTIQDIDIVENLILIIDIYVDYDTLEVKSQPWPSNDNIILFSKNNEVKDYLKDRDSNVLYVMTVNIERMHRNDQILVIGSVEVYPLKEVYNYYYINDHSLKKTICDDLVKQIAEKRKSFNSIDNSIKTNIANWMLIEEWFGDFEAYWNNNPDMPTSLKGYINQNFNMSII